MFFINIFARFVFIVLLLEVLRHHIATQSTTVRACVGIKLLLSYLILVDDNIIIIVLIAVEKFKLYTHKKIYPMAIN